LEKNADGTIDYGMLNQELSQTGNTLSPEGAAKNAATLAALQDIEEDEAPPIRRHPERRDKCLQGDEVSYRLTNYLEHFLSTFLDFTITLV